MTGPLTKINGEFQIESFTIFDEQISTLAGIQESKLSFDNSSGHDHDGINSKAISYNNLSDLPNPEEESALSFYLRLL